MQLTLPDHPGRDVVERIVEHLQQKLSGDPSLEAENEQLKKEIARLKERNRKVERKMIQQQLKINELSRKNTAPEVQRKSGRRK